jgi:hypothetical protein
MPYIMEGKPLNQIKDLVFNPNIVYFTDNFQTLDKWNINGSYQITSDGIELSGDSTIISKDNILDGKDNYVIVVDEQVNTADNWTLIGLTDENGNPIFTMKWNKDNYSLEFYVQGNKVKWWNFNPNDWDGKVIIHKIGNRILWYSTFWIILPDNISLKKVMFGTSGGDITFKNIGIYESAGNGTGWFRPIWNGNKILEINGVYYFIGNRFYDPYYDFPEIALPSIFTTADMINFNQYRHLWLDTSYSYGVNYAYYDGEYVYVWLVVSSISSAPPTPVGYYILTLDPNSNFNIVNINENVTVSELPQGTNLVSLYFINLHGKWYAIGLLSYRGDDDSFGYSIALFNTESPKSANLTYVRTIYDFGYNPSPSPLGASLCSHVVTDLYKNYVLITALDRWILFDDKLNNIVASGFCHQNSELPDDCEFLLSTNKFVYETYVMPVWW